MHSRPPSPLLPDVEGARREVEAARRDRERLLWEASASPGEAKEKQLKTALDRERTAQQNLVRTLSRWLSADAHNDVARLSADYPIVLLPVRLETRFGRGSKGPELQVRIYPDEIYADAHEERLTTTERDAGFAYWNTFWDTGDEPRAWRALVGRFSSGRAAWIVQQTSPTNLQLGISGQPTFLQPAERPAFPDIALRPSSWTRAVESNVLPDRWIVIAYRGKGEVGRAYGNPIVEPLALTFSPLTTRGSQRSQPNPPDPTAPASPFQDPDIQWTVDFQKAKEVGMAVTLDLTAEDAANGFDRVIAVGVKATLPPDRGAERLSDLLEAILHTRVMAFVPQGTPTNNTTANPSGCPPADRGGASSFRVERGPPLADGEPDRTQFMEALGVPPTLADHVGGMKSPAAEDARADLAEALRTPSEQESARAMNNALWPATLGYFVEQMLGPVLGRQASLDARRYFLDYVRGRGPFPAFRVGATPYGLLPVSSLSNWRPLPGETGTAAHLPQLLQVLRGYWLAPSAAVPRIGATTDPDADLIAVLGQDASAREVNIRDAIGYGFYLNLLKLLGADLSNISREHLQKALDILAKLGHPEWNPRILGMNYTERSDRIGLALVTNQTPSEQSSLGDIGGQANYIDWIRTRTSPEELREDRVPSPILAMPLLFHLLRHSALMECAGVALDILIRHGLATEADRWQTELVGIAPESQGRATSWDWLARPVPAVSGATPLGQYLLSRTGTPETAPLEAFKNSLATLKVLPTAELQRLFTETLDVCSHRLDAWITSLATMRLMGMRGAGPQGSYLGGYGWVEDLRPTPPGRYRQVPVPGGGYQRVQANSGGYIFGPSQDHVAAAAILRNAYLSRKGPDAAPYEVDLSSRRVRTATWLLDSLRGGQRLGAILGYRFERALHERGLTLEQFIEPLRRRYPLQGGDEEESEGPQEVIPPRNVVDGLKLVSAVRTHQDPIDELGKVLGGAPPPSPDQHQALLEEISALDDALDAVTDLLTAESVHQAIKGKITAAAATLDSLAGEARPPDPEIARQPRSGITLAHRVAVVLGGDPTTNGAWRTQSPRALAEPYLNAWAGSLLGDPSKIQCRVTYVDAASDAQGNQQERLVTLDDLELSPLDFMALAQTAADEGRASELDLRVVSAALGDSADLSRVKVTYAPSQDWDRREIRSFSEILEVVRAIKSVLGGSRPLGPNDLLPPEAGVAASIANRLEAEAMDRAMAAGVSLRQRAEELAGVIESVAPAVTIVEPADGTTLGARTITIRGTAANADRVEVRLVAGGWVTAQGLRHWSADVDFASLPNGTYAVEARAVKAEMEAFAQLSLGLNAPAVSLGSASSPVHMDQLMKVLREASLYGIQGAFPAPSGANPEALQALLDRASSTLDEIRRRLQAADVLHCPTCGAVVANGACPSHGAVQGASLPAQEMLKAVFGRDFLFLPRFMPAEADELAQALAHGPTLVSTPLAVMKWLQQAARVREPLGRWRRLSLYAGALNGEPPHYDVAQLPHRDDARWLALPLPPDADPPPSGRISLVLHRVATPEAHEPWVGLFLDEWTEVIPSRTESAAIAFHYDDPGAEAPHAVLIAVPPTEAPTWDLDSLVATVQETLDLAKIRAVDGDLLGDLGQVLPAIFIAQNVANQTISMDFSRAREAMGVTTRRVPTPAEGMTTRLGSGGGLGSEGPR